jgi:hypothetical protein
LSVDVGEEVLSSSGMFEGSGEKLVELFVAGIEGVHIVLIIVFDPVPLIHFL